MLFVHSSAIHNYFVYLSYRQKSHKNWIQEIRELDHVISNELQSLDGELTIDIVYVHNALG